MSAQLRVIRGYIGFLSVVSPAVAAKKAFELFQKVRIKSIRNREKDFFDQSDLFIVPFAKEDLNCYRLGDPDGDLVILVHGWESNAGSMSQIAFSLAEKGKHVVAFDLPGHAAYNRDSTNLLECRMAMRAVIEHINPSSPFSVVSHSFGSAVTAFTISEMDYAVNQLIFLTGPNKVENIFREFQQMINLGNRAYDKMVDITEKILGESIKNVSIQYNLNRAKFDRLTLIHDRNDKILPYQNSAEIHEAVQHSELIPFENIGHYRMLWNKEVITKVTNLLGS